MLCPLKGSHHPWPTPQGSCLCFPSPRVEHLCQLLGTDVLQPGTFVSSSSFIYSIIYLCSCGLVDIYFALRVIIQHCWDFPAGPVVKIPRWGYRWCGFHRWLGNEDPACGGAAKVTAIVQHRCTDCGARAVPALAAGGALICLCVPSSQHHGLWLLPGTPGWPRLILTFLTLS